MKITIVGLGYVGLSNACLFARHHEVVALDISRARVAQVNQGKTPIIDPDISAALASTAIVLGLGFGVAGLYMFAVACKSPKQTKE